MAQPIVPSNRADPTGQDRRERGAINEFSRRMRQIGKIYRQALDRIPFEEITVNAVAYEFRIDPAILSQLFDETGRLVDAILLEGGENQLWFSLDYIVPAYRQGSAQTHANLSAQSRAYAATRPTLTDLFMTPAYQRRIGLLMAREFEEMRGLAGDVKKNMGFQLSQGMATGISPRQIARNLATQLGIEDRRAYRIARTEVNNALRQARLDESQQATVELGIQTKQMHLSALSPTTRATHRRRHGLLYSVQEQKEWWTVDGNAINCKCSTTEVLVDDAGEPLSPALVERVRRQVQK